LFPTQNKFLTGPREEANCHAAATILCVKAWAHNLSGHLRRAQMQVGLEAALWPTSPAHARPAGASFSAPAIPSLVFAAHERPQPTANDLDIFQGALPEFDLRL
jgi:hypothetical protein